MIVVDASVVTVALIDDGSDGVRVRTVLSGQALAAPELIDLEVLTVLRRQVRARAMTPGAPSLLSWIWPICR